MANNKINSIINVTVNGMKATDAIASVKSRLETIEKSAFNIALLCAYTLGDTIPEYTDTKGDLHAQAICDKPIKKQADMLKLIGRSKATLSRWLKAYRLIVEKGYFNDFATGLYPFSYDKIIIILENEESFKGYMLADLMTMTVDTLETMADKTEEVQTEATEEEAKSEEEATEEVATDEKTEEVAKVEVSFVYNDTRYYVDKATFEAWLSENAIVK